MPSPKKILLIKLRALGDTVLLSSSIQSVHQAFPEAEIHCLVPDRWADVITGHPGVKEVWRFHRPASLWAKIRYFTRLALQLRREHFAWTINFHASPSSGALAYAVGSRVRSVHWHGLTDKNKYSTVTIAGKGQVKPILERDADALRAVGILIETVPLPKIFLTAQECEAGRHHLTQWGLRAPLLIIGLGASRKNKAWPTEYFAEVAANFLEQETGCVLCLAGPGDQADLNFFRNTTEAILTRMNPEASARHEKLKRLATEVALPLRLISAVMRTGVLYLGNDSGPKHLAVASGLNTLTLFGPENPFEWHPYPTDRHPFLYSENLSGRPDQGTDILPGMVYEKLKSQL